MENRDDYIIPYLSGTLSKEEKERVESFLENDPTFKKDLEESEAVYHYLEKLKFQESIDVEKNWNQLSARISRLRSGTKLLQFCKSAAAVLFMPLLLALGYVYYQTHVEQSVEIVEQTCAPGLITAITLTDGTQVWLNAGSKLIYPKEFQNKTRTVRLEGEAYFKVQTDKKHRFEVELVNDIRVSAYGTEFNISAHYGNKQIEVVLAKGNVDVIDNKNRSYTLEPDCHLILDESEPVYEKTNVYVKTAWKDGRMVFRRAGMEEIAEKLALHFNVDIELIDEEISDYQLTATFTTESITQILRLIEKSTPIRWTIIEPVKQEDMSYTKQKIIFESLNKSYTNKY